MQRSGRTSAFASYDRKWREECQRAAGRVKRELAAALRFRTQKGWAPINDRQAVLRPVTKWMIKEMKANKSKRCMNPPAT